MSVPRDEAREPRLAAGVDEPGGDFVGGFGEDFTGGVVDEVLGEEQAERRFGSHFDLVDPGGFHLAPRALGDGLSGLHQHVAFLVDDVGEGGFLAVQLGIEAPGDPAVVLKLVDFLLVEAVEDFGLAHAHGLEQDRGGHLAASVDADVQDVLVVEVEVEPRAAHGDHAAGVEHLAAGVRLAAVVLEDDAGRALELVDDDALGSVDDEGSLFGHQGQGSKIDILFLDIANGAGFGLVVHVIDDEADLDAHRGFIGKTLGDAFRLIVLGLADFVADEFEAGGTVEVFDWEDRTEDPFQTFIGETFYPSLLHEFPVGVHLQVEQVGNLHLNLDLAKLFGKLTHHFTSEKVGRQKPERARVARSRNHSCIKNATRSTT